MMGVSVLFQVGIETTVSGTVCYSDHLTSFAVVSGCDGCLCVDLTSFAVVSVYDGCLSFISGRDRDYSE